MKSRSKNLENKSISSMLSAIEIYNKPDFKYREETFSILATNAWELLLKARVLQLANNKLASILKYEKRTNKNGKLSVKAYKSKNRSGNYNTIGIFKAFDILVNDYGDKIEEIVRKNLEALVEIRNNSVHFINKDFSLSKKIHEIGTASIKNYISLRELWFGGNFSKYEIFIMPIGFIRGITSAEVISVSGEEKKLLEYIKSEEKKSDQNKPDGFNFSLNVDIKFNRVKSSKTITEVQVTNDENALKVQLTEEDVLEKYPWSYQILTTRLNKKYSDFKQNQHYHKIRKELESNPKLCRIRLLNPSNPNSSKQKFYSHNIVREFDKHYSTKK